MHTDSAYRFERGVDYDLQWRAVQRATGLLLVLAGGKAGPVIEAVAPQYLPQRTPISLRKDRIDRVLGLLPDAGTVMDILKRLGMEVSIYEDGWQVTPPSFRFDIALEADLIEEIGRVYGYDRLPSRAPVGDLGMHACPEAGITINRIAEVLVDLGYQETITYSFVEPEFQHALNPVLRPIALENPISSEMSVMRTSLWPGLLRATLYNLNRQASRLRLFEHGLRFFLQGNVIKQDYVFGGVLTGDCYPEHWDGKSSPVDFYDVRHDIETILSFPGRADEYQFVSGEHPALHPGQTALIRRDDSDIGWLGRIHPVIAGQYDLDPNTYLYEFEYAAVQDGVLVQFQELSRYPSIRRDLAVVVDEDVPAVKLKLEIQRAVGERLKGLVIFDVYQGVGIETGRKSIAFGLILQDSSRTLTDDDVELIVSRVTDGLNKKFGAALRE